MRIVEVLPNCGKHQAYKLIMWTNVCKIEVQRVCGTENEMRPLHSMSLILYL